MHRLMQLLRTGVAGGKPVMSNLVGVVRNAVESRAAGRPVPGFACEHEEIWLQLDPDRMTSVIENLIQNAQDATPDDGSVRVSLTRRDNRLRHGCRVHPRAPVSPLRHHQGRHRDGHRCL
jgi:signal transduction histidine kinase